MAACSAPRPFKVAALVCADDLDVRFKACARHPKVLQKLGWESQ